MKKLLVLILLLMPLMSIAQKTIFAGKWNLNQQKTDFTRIPNWLATRSYEIKQKNDAITIEAKIYDDQMVGHYYTETIPFDGSTVQTITYGDNKRIVSMKWSFDYKSFVLSVRIPSVDDQPGSDFTETWSLENDGKTLLVERVAAQADGFSFRTYYDKN